MFKTTIKALLMLLIPVSVFSQVVTTNPAFPTDNQAVTIVFHAQEGDGGLADFTEDIWAHTGVITNESSSGSDWKYVIAEWSENTDKAKLTRINSNTYELNIEPSIRAFYGVPEGEEIQKMTFVFRNADGTKTGRATGGLDIFVDVYEAGLNVNIESPINGEIVALNQQIPIVAQTTDAEFTRFFINDELIGEYDAQGFTYDFTATNAGKTSFKVEAWSQGESAVDSAYIFVKGEVEIAELPTGMRDGVNYIDDHTVLLSLLAPGKEYAFAIGDFSNWEVNDEVFMKRTPDGERFWIQINNLQAGEPYIYQYYIDGELTVADVYSEQISDPWNDEYISEEIFPNLPQYPFGKTNGIASVFTTAQTPYEWQIENFEAPKKTDLVIYEVLIRDLSEEHSFQFLIDTLSYFKSLGVNTIELMPINEFEGNNSWGYNPSFYFAVDKYYGTKDKLKEFIDACHAQGIAVVIDMVLNHSYGQNPQVQMYWDGENSRPAADNPWFNTVSPNQSYHWGYDFNHESNYTKAFVDSVNSFWIEEFKVDGFRFDFTKGFTNKPGDGWAYDASRINILQRMAQEIWKVDEDAYVIFEHLADNSEEKVLSAYDILLWGNMNHKYKEANMGYNSSDKSDLSWASYQKRGWSKPHVVAYMESHDEERQMVFNNTWGNGYDWYQITNENIGLKRIEMSTLFHLMIPGPKMFWQFGELGYDYSINWPSGTSDDRLTPKPPKWEYQEQWRRKNIQLVTASLNKLKTNYDTWETENFELDVRGEIKTVTLLHEDMNAIAIGNFSVGYKTVEIVFPQGGQWYSFFNDEEDIVLNDQGVWQVLLAPGAYYLFTDKQISEPDLGTGVENNVGEEKSFKYYPNPSNGLLWVETTKSINNIEVYGSMGQRVFHKRIASSNKPVKLSINTKSWANGVYILKLQDNKGEIQTAKLVVK
ncbi:MAG: alpha-amylase [Bacteroidetes bacterium 4572_77]|nr:MAG: alpha-amylase [Bacteroidetes bacterium 4572_77]